MIYISTYHSFKEPFLPLIHLQNYIQRQHYKINALKIFTCKIITRNSHPKAEIEENFTYNYQRSNCVLSGCQPAPPFAHSGLSALNAVTPFN